MLHDLFTHNTCCFDYSTELLRRKSTKSTASKVAAFSFQIRLSGKTEEFTLSCVACMSSKSRVVMDGDGSPGLPFPREPVPPESHPEAAHLHTLNVPQQDISDSLVIPSDVGVRAAFPESKGKGVGNKSISSGNITRKRPGLTSQNSKLCLPFQSPIIYTSPFSGRHTALAPEGASEIAPVILQTKKSLGTLKETGKNHFAIILIWSYSEFSPIHTWVTWVSLQELEDHQQTAFLPPRARA